MPRSRQEQFDALTTAISRVLTPVLICMALSVWFVHSLGNPESCRRLGKGRSLSEISITPGVDANSLDNSASTQYSSLWAGVFIAIFVVLLVGFTFLLVWLYKSGRSKYIVIWLMVAVALIFAYVGGLYIFDFCRSRCINLDWITLVIAVWNFTITGLFAVFGVVPRIVNQAYLIVMSALMAYIFRSLPAWSIWAILAALVLWDLYAVLAPHGPLKKLVEASRERDEPLPALVYDTNPHDIGRDASAQPSVVIPNMKKRRPKPPAPAPDHHHTVDPDDPHPPHHHQHHRTESPSSTAPAPTVSLPDPSSQHRLRLFRKKRNGVVPPAHDDARQSSEEATPAAAAAAAAAAAGPPTAAASAEAEAEVAASRTRASGRNGTPESDEIRVGTLGAHLKLGLGDFVFYSILVAQASTSGAMTTIACFVAILAGLCATLFLVTVYRKALPALPISITAGLLFYFLTRYTVQPFVNNLLPELLFY